ncbi:IPT/TIG domain-containing protein [Hymenobacter siberiensis]|uniref:IPT/TIG domain-containing protein n=1 Tax=Hymenobacter siberiensis TaxID=2848396 RepID=UPI001C1E452E
MPFTPGNIVVTRVGDGTATLTAVATVIYLDEYTPAGVLVQSVALPTAVTGNNRILTASGNSTSELVLSRTGNGRSLLLAGYGTSPGTAAVASSQAADVARVVGVVSPDGSVDTSTSLGSAFNASNVRAVASADGTDLYVVGGNSGVQYVTFGGFNPTQLNTSPTNLRGVAVAGGNLYISTASSSYIGLSAVGTGLPTAAGQTVAILPGFPATAAGPSPYGFYFADLSTTVPGVDVLYVADDRSGTGGGIQKWSLVAGTWTLNGIIAGSATTMVRGLDGNTTGTTVSLVATSATGLYLLSDNTGYNVAPTLTSIPAPVATAATNTAFRGIAFAPVAPAPLIASFSPTSGPVGTTVTVTGSFLTGASALTLNGVAVTGFTVVDASTITFVVPAGATSGTIAVTTAGGMATSTGTFTVVAPNPLPVISSLTPATAVAGAAAFTLTLNGTGFYSGSVVSFNGTALATTFVSATQLTASVPAAAIATAGTCGVTVINAAPGGGTSAGATFTVTVPVPTITSFTPTTGGPGTSVTITGTNFTGATVVRIGSFNVPNFTVVNATTITLVLPAGTGSVTGLLTVTTPGGTTTSATSFNLVSATLASQALPGLSVFPNPATDHLTVDLPSAAPATVALRDLTGRLVLAPAPLGADKHLALPATLASGVYFLEVRQSGLIAVRRIEKR